MRKKVYIYVNGIMTKPGQSDNWTGRAVTWTHLNTNHRAEKVEYWVGPVSRAFNRGQKRRAYKLAKTVRFYAARDWEIILVGHSNGANVIGNASRLVPKEQRKRVSAVYLFAAAADPDFQKTGLNRWSAPVTLFNGGKDGALNLAHGIGRVLGYGGLGLLGVEPKNAKVPVTVISKEDFDHGTWFSDLEFDRSLNEVTK